VKKSLLMRGMVAAALLASVATTAVVATPAQAAVPNTTNLVAVGSDTTQDVMATILGLITPGAGTGLYNIKAQQTPAVAVPADSTCSTGITFDTPAGVGETLAPNGSGAGRNALKAEETAGPGSTPRGCVDFARSSGAPRGLATDGANMEYYAYAMDSVGIVTASPYAPGSISQADLLKIYNCTYSDWAQLPGGGEGPIQRYIPNLAGSGTASFFKSDLLGGFDSTTVSALAGAVPGSPYACAPVIVTGEENDFKNIATANHDSAIMPFSVGQWLFMSKLRLNPTLDLRYGTRVLGQVTGTAVNANTIRWEPLNNNYVVNSGILSSTPVNEANVKVNTAAPDFYGIRYVYNVADTVVLDYADVKSLIGFSNVAAGTKSTLCSGGFASTISSAGFQPLSAVGNPGDASHNLAGSTCRKYIN
jgi:ABC-type phosphate transport system substrate-binding protein